MQAKSGGQFLKQSSTWNITHGNSLPQHCVAYLSEAEKSTRAYQAYGKVSPLDLAVPVTSSDRKDRSFTQAVTLAHETPLPDVPLQIRNAPTNLMKTLGYGKHYSYNPDYKHPVHNVSGEAHSITSVHH
jgi:replication-associated recombination protein RarA